MDYIPEVCPCCKQSTTYVLSIGLGVTEIVKAIARHIQVKGINAVHPRKELEGKTLTSNQVGNLSWARMHGLIAKIDGNAGNYCLTRKGSAFLRGTPVHKYVTRSKVEERTIGYFGDEMCTIHDFQPGDVRWEGINFTIEEGHIIYDL